MFVDSLVESQVLMYPPYREKIK
uniref:Uncharacterized protein n=1 Tax=Arundo donax TaxID=35708 RepID=A0A0A9BC79_ARUDO